MGLTKLVDINLLSYFKDKLYADKITPMNEEINNLQNEKVSSTNVTLDGGLEEEEET